MIEIIKSVRNLRAENNVMPNKTIKLQIYARNKNAEFLAEVIELIG
jgi:valyl-tRNA synthetase